MYPTLSRLPRISLTAGAILALAQGCTAFADGQKAPDYILDGAWQMSSLHGHNPEADSYYTMQVGDTATWKPNFAAPVRATLSLYKIVHDSNNDSNVTVTVNTANGAQQQSIDFSTGTSGWVELGTYDFSGSDAESIVLTKQTPSRPTRAAALRFDVLNEAGTDALHSFTVSQTTESNFSDTIKIAKVYQDILDNPNLVKHLVAREVLTDSTTGQNFFAPDAAADAGTLALWLARIIGLQEAGEYTAPTLAQKQSAISDLAGAGISLGTQPDQPVSKSALLDALFAATQWAEKPLGTSFDLTLAELEAQMQSVVPAGETLAAPAPYLTRGQAATLLSAFAKAVIYPAPPLGHLTDSNWQLTFEDQFSGNTLDLERWAVESGAPGHIRSSRWPENVVVEDGLLRLVTKKENRGGKEWTSGNIWSKVFRQKYGYFEARIRINNATGLNNAFWLMNKNYPRTEPGLYEIDIVEAHYPRRAHLTLHSWSGTHTKESKIWYLPENLSDDFHIYSLLWTPERLIFYVDGVERLNVVDTVDKEPYPVRLSTAVLPFAGIPGDNLDGSSMDVDWVRVWQFEE